MAKCRTKTAFFSHFSPLPPVESSSPYLSDDFWRPPCLDRRQNNEESYGNIEMTNFNFKATNMVHYCPWIYFALASSKAKDIRRKIRRRYHSGNGMLFGKKAVLYRLLIQAISLKFK